MSIKTTVQKLAKTLGAMFPSLLIVIETPAVETDVFFFRSGQAEIANVSRRHHN